MGIRILVVEDDELIAASVVRGLREARGWSQENLANRANLNCSYMGEIERAAATPSLVTAEKLALALEVSLSSLILQCER